MALERKETVPQSTSTWRSEVMLQEMRYRGTGGWWPFGADETVRQVKGFFEEQVDKFQKTLGQSAENTKTWALEHIKPAVDLAVKHTYETISSSLDIFCDLVLWVMNSAFTGMYLGDVASAMAECVKHVVESLLGLTFVVLPPWLANAVKSISSLLIFSGIQFALIKLDDSHQSLQDAHAASNGNSDANENAAPAAAPAAAEDDLVKNIAELKALKDAGALEDDEFKAAKAKLLLYPRSTPPLPETNLRDENTQRKLRSKLRKAVKMAREAREEAVRNRDSPRSILGTTDKNELSKEEKLQIDAVLNPMKENLKKLSSSRLKKVANTAVAAARLTRLAGATPPREAPRLR